MTSICCTIPKPEYKAELTPEEFKKFCMLVHVLRRKGFHLGEAQTRAYSTVLAESIEG